ncbi:MAG: hypothetical protein HQL30_12085 [Candidatus Omnitrophica bacterium]|nr:hypothetical protein [Candidatus Omnitrophota bacterium]
MAIVLIILMSLSFSGNDAYGSGIFNYEKIRFFEDKNTDLILNGVDPVNRDVEEDLWSERIVTDSGEIKYYTPPKKVKDFLDDPTEINAREYLAWNISRLQKMSKAQEVLKQVMAEYLDPGGTGVSDGNNRLSKTAILSGKNTVTVFILKDCKYCAEQISILNEILKEFPGITLKAILKGYNSNTAVGFPCEYVLDDGFSAAAGIKLWPSILIEKSNGNNILINGFVGREKLAGIFSDM